jgi:hypothetical protein
MVKSGASFPGTEVLAQEVHASYPSGSWFGNWLASPGKSCGAEAPRVLKPIRRALTASQTGLELEIV